MLHMEVRGKRAGTKHFFFKYKIIHFASFTMHKTGKVATTKDRQGCQCKRQIRLPLQKTDKVDDVRQIKVVNA